MKKILAFLLVAVLILGCSAGVSGSDLICFVGVNDTIPISLPGEASPYYDNGTLYIPFTALDCGPGGIFTSYNVDKNTFVVATGHQRLVYDLVQNTVTDEDGSTSDVFLTYHGGLLFIPGQLTANHFGLEISLLTSQTGCPILRFTNGSQVYDDATFVSKAESLISYMLEHYAAKEEDRPKNPDFIEVDKKEPEQEQQEELGPGTVYLAFAGEAVSRETMMHLEAISSKAVFFVTESQLREQKDLIRSIYGKGHNVAITVEPGETDMAAGLERANEALDEVLFCKSLLALVPDGTAPEGYVTVSESRGTSVTQIVEHPEQTCLLICRSNVLEILTILIHQDVTFPQLTETTQLPI